MLKEELEIFSSLPPYQCKSFVLKMDAQKSCKATEKARHCLKVDAD